MGLMNSSLQIGRSALLGYQSALQVVGSNISSAGSPDYTRLSPQLDPLQGQLLTGELQPGAGVALTAIQRNIDEALESRVRLAIGGTASTATQLDAMTQVEAVFDDLSGLGVGSLLTAFFNSFDELQSTPEDQAIRDFVINSGVQLAQGARDLRTRLTQISEGIDAQIAGAVDSANMLVRDLARLNSEITTTEAGRRGQATGLRDQRDAILRQLSEIFDVTVREQPDGAINVYAGSETLVQGSVSRELVAVEELAGDTLRRSVRFVDTQQQLDIRGGRLEGLLVSRDRDTQIGALDRLASAIIADVNRLHADGQGMSAFTTVTGSYDVLAADAALDSSAAGLAFPPHDGSFYITVSDDVTGTPVAHRIDVDFGSAESPTTLESLVESINDEVDGVTASVTSDNRLSIQADTGLSFTFGYDGQESREDTSGVLAALGINTFFVGTDARNIAVNDTLLEPGTGSLLLAGAQVFLSGDGSNARRIAGLDTAVSEGLGAASISDFYGSMANRVAMTTASARDSLLASDSVLGALQAQRESISGVNLDEEAIALVKFERAFQGASRFIRVVDDLLAELIQLIR